MGSRDTRYPKYRKGASRLPQAGSAMTPESETDKHFAKLLGILEQRFENGDKTVILKAIQQCFLMKRPVPEWLRLAFLQAYDAATGYEIKSWAEAFGPPHPKGSRHSAHHDHHRPQTRMVWDLPGPPWRLVESEYPGLRNVRRCVWPGQG